jgi:Domain of unknown function (DUF4129)
VIAAADPDQARQQAHDVLGRSEFRPHESLLQQIRDSRIYRWIADHMPDLHFTGGGGGQNGLLAALGTILELVLLVGLAGLLIWLVLRLAHRWQRRPALDGDETSVETDTVEPPRPAGYWRAEAERLEAAGQWREALRARYRELIADLATAGIIEEIPGRTAGEYRTDLAAGRPSDGPAFDAATGLFEGAWYGGEATGPDQARRFRELVTAIDRGEP